MITQIIPLRRLPASISFFDYGVPEELGETIKPGQLVQIPFQSKSILGLVFSVSPDENEKLKPIEKILQGVPLFSKQRMDWMMQQSARYHVSPSVMARVMLPPLKKRRIAGEELSDDCFKIQSEKQSFHLYNNETERSDVLKRLTKDGGTTLILVPEIQDIEPVTSSLKGDEVFVWHSRLSEKEKYETWMKVRQNKHMIVIGTRSAIFLPFQHLESIIIDKEHHSEHKHWDGQPRFDVRTLADSLAPAHLLDMSPSARIYHDVHKKHINTEGLVLDPIAAQVVDMNQERIGKNFTPLSHAAENAIRSSAGSVFVYHNRKGYATSVCCSSCQQVFTCHKCELSFSLAQSGQLSCFHCSVSKPVSRCESCGSKELFKLQGTGLDRMAATIRSAQDPADTRPVIVVDKDSDEEPVSPAIIVGTRAAVGRVDWSSIDAVIMSHPDHELLLPEYNAAENVWHRIKNFSYLLKGDPLIIQTFVPDHVLFRSLVEPDRFFRTDLNLRRALLYPPYAAIARYLCGNASQPAAQMQATKVFEALQTSLTNDPKPVKILRPVPTHPARHRGKFWYTMAVKMDAGRREEITAWLQSYIPAHWIADPDPAQLLKP